ALAFLARSRSCLAKVVPRAATDFSFGSGRSGSVQRTILRPDCTNLAIHPADQVQRSHFPAKAHFKSTGRGLSPMSRTADREPRDGHPAYSTSPDGPGSTNDVQPRRRSAKPAASRRAAEPGRPSSPGPFGSPREASRRSPVEPGNGGGAGQGPAARSPSRLEVQPPRKHERVTSDERHTHIHTPIANCSRVVVVSMHGLPDRGSSSTLRRSQLHSAVAKASHVAAHDLVAVTQRAGTSRPPRTSDGTCTRAA